MNKSHTKFYVRPSKFSQIYYLNFNSSPLPFHRLPEMRLLNHILLLTAVLAAQAERLVRFTSTDGREYYGDAILPPGTTDASKSTSARVIEGDILGNFTVTKQVKVTRISVVLCCPTLTISIANSETPLSSSQ